MSGGSTHEDILFCLTIPEHETAQGMFSVLRGYIDEKQIPWCLKVGFRIGLHPSIAGRRAGLYTLVMNVSPSATQTYCLIHPMS